MGAIRRYIKTNQYLHFLFRVIQNMNNPIFRKQVIGIIEDPGVVWVEEKGEEYPNELFYVVDIDDSGNNSGFFAIYNNTVKRLELADRIGATPSVRWTNTAYNDKEIGDTDNLFLYYFKEICNVGIDTINNCKNVVFSKPQDGFALEEGNLYVQLENHLDEAARIIKKYIRLNEETESLISGDIEKILLSPLKTIAVHYRGTDYGAGWKGHPKQVNYNEMITNAQRIMSQNDCEYVFLATDDTRAINAFKNAFGQKLVFYQDVFRSEGKMGIHYQNSKRDKHRYLLGLEIIRDVYTMASCKCFLGGKSQVGFAVRAINRAFYKEFADCVIIDKGVNEKGIDSQKLNRQYFSNKPNKKMRDEKDEKNK